MISYHPSIPNTERPNQYAKGFKTADTSDLERLSKGITKYVWSAIIWKDGRRTEKNFIEARYAVLDFDDGEMDLPGAVKSFCDMQHIIGTTKSHQVEKHGLHACDRFRVVIPFQRPITDLAQYRHTMERIRDKYPIDRACIDGGRFFWPCTQIISIEINGYTQDVHQASNELQRNHMAKIERCNRLGLTPQWAANQLKVVIPAGQRSRTFWAMARDLLMCGFKPDEILGWFIASKTFEGGATDHDRRKLAGAVDSAVKSVLTYTETKPNELQSRGNT